ncbi:P-loop NTPase fold protein [Leisingera sp. McT4-56]|uniref:P-loop NTPase fold protein n=1 Tax=Leisingera sp. McT4-56 TaxID=2881255 RepID=UPI001CF848F4|nr:P-loop NTPase fold protein [Leisingera sp. McT4-56]MCB4458536.1 hypothetical protein [Leisingera sp. McT4-56]
MQDVIPRATREEAIQYLNQYVAAKKTDYAVMIDGPWGSGKTNFVIEAYLKPRRAAAKDKGCDETADYWYASLASAVNPNDIYEQFFVSQYGETTKWGAEIASRLAAYYSKKTAGTKEDAEKVKRAMLNPRGKVLVFDDLERSVMPVLQVLALAHSFAADGHKVIVIAHDDEIAKVKEDERNEYLRQKEKFVGKTVRVGSEPEDLLPTLIDRMSCALAQESVRRAKTTLLEVFHASGRLNLRSFRQGIEDFDYLTTHIEKELHGKEEAADALLLFLLAIEIEYRAGKDGLTFEDVRNLGRECWTAILSRTPSETAARLKSTYPMVRWEDPVVHPEHIAVLMKSGTVSTAEVVKHVRSHPLIAPRNHIPAWRRLWNWSALTRSDYTAARAELINQLSNHTICHPGELLHVIGVVIRLREFGDDLLDGAELIDFFKAYLQQVVDARTLIPDMTTFGLSSGSYHGLMYLAKDELEFCTIRDNVREAVEQARDVEMRDLAPRLMAEISADQMNALKICNYGGKGEGFQNVPFLHHIDPGEFASLLVDEGAPRETVMSALIKRYEMDKHQKVLAAEHDWLADMEHAFGKIAKVEGPPYSRLLEFRKEWMRCEFDKHLERKSDGAQGSA